MARRGGFGVCALLLACLALGCGNNGFSNQAPPSGDVPPTGGVGGSGTGVGGGAGSGSASGSGVGSSVGDFDAGTVGIDMAGGCTTDAECPSGQACVLFEGMGTCRISSPTPP